MFTSSSPQPPATASSSSRSRSSSIKRVDPLIFATTAAAASVHGVVGVAASMCCHRRESGGFHHGRRARTSRPRPPFLRVLSRCAAPYGRRRRIPASHFASVRSHCGDDCKGADICTHSYLLTTCTPVHAGIPAAVAIFSASARRRPAPADPADLRPKGKREVDRRVQARKGKCKG
jgi:hypothetical protein